MNIFYMILTLLPVLVIHLVLTILIELFVLFLLGFKDKRLYAAVILINLITNPTLNIMIFLNQKLLNSYGYFYVIFLEALVVLWEYLMLKLAFRQSKIPFFRLSFVLNASSFLVGLALAWPLLVG